MALLQQYLQLFDISSNGLNAFLLWGFTVSLVLFLLYFLLIFSRLIFYKTIEVKVLPDPVSVVIASRDDANMLRKHLPMVMQQKGVTYEVIVVDDCSLDDTIDVLREYAECFSNFKHSRIFESGDFEGGKKFAVTIGIKAAKYQKLVFIDADCYPNSDQWLRKMAERLMVKKVVLGYGPYKIEKGLLNKVIRYDTYKIALQYLSFSLAGIPYMGVGRNLAYHSYLYFDAKGFTSHLNVVSGDDDLFVNNVSNSKNTGIEIVPESFVYSVAKKTYANWEFQKRRHLTTASKYKFYHQVLLFLLPVSQYLLNFTFILLLVRQFEWEFVLAMYGVKVFIQGLIHLFAMRRLKVIDLFVWSILLEPLLMLFYPWVSFLNIVKGDQRKRWI